MQPQNPYDPQQQQGQPGQYGPQPQSPEFQYQDYSGQLYQPVFVQRPLQPEAPVMNEEIRRKHEESKKKYPYLNLSEGEFVISNVRRHPIGILSIWASTFAVITTILLVLALFLNAQQSTLGSNGGVPVGALAAIAGLLCLLTLIGGYIAAFIYNANTFFLTNESVIQHIQTALFSSRNQTVSLSNIEDASHAKHGILQSILDYGSIRLSTEGDETTYRFNFASHPEKQVAILNNAVEAFKNGRPVVGED